MEKPMILKVYEEYGKVVGVVVKDVPAYCGSADIQHTFELAAAAGDKVAQQAVAACGPYWIKMNVEGDYWVFLDN